METISKEQILKQAKIVENYQGNESEILGAEKGGKFHGFIAGAEWAIEKLEADKAELLELLHFAKRHCKKPAPVLFDKIESLIQKHKQ